MFLAKEGGSVNDIMNICSRMYTMQQLPLSLVDEEGRILQSWPEIFKDSIRPEMTALVIRDFVLQDRDALHPLISYLEEGYFVGVVEIDAGHYLIIGLVSPYRHTRKELMELCAGTVYPDRIQQYCDAAMLAPLMTLPQMRACAGLLVQLFSGRAIPEEDILFNDNADRRPYSEKRLSALQFRQREEAEEHTKLGFETAFRQAIRLGRSDLLLKALTSSAGGTVGYMSLNAQRQRQYTFISFVTLVSRAAMEGGLPEETAYLLSDLYCQRMDLLSEQSEFDRLSLGMAMDFCEKVAGSRLPDHVSPPVRKALNYISVHLHESFGVEDLAAHCNLCRRSLSLHFKKEMGIGIVDYVQREKINEARYLLEHTDLPIPDISSHLNYSSQSYFTAQFKKLVSETPERYRNRRRSH